MSGNRSASSLSEDDPVSGSNSADAFPKIVGGQGVYFDLADGRRVLDGSNTGGPLGHGHPEMVEALTRAASAPVVNESWPWVERAAAADELLASVCGGDDAWLGEVYFCLSGSEANDLALSLCQAVTGRGKLATRERAYHGASGLARDVTLQPHCHGGLSWADGRVDPVPRGAEVIQLPGPCGERIGGRPSDPDADVRQLAGAEKALADVAGVIVDYTQGGTYFSAAYQDALARAAARAGALWVADEVVSGFGRTGVRFSFNGTEARPQLVTLGKGLGGGAAPVGAVVLSRDLAERIRQAHWTTSGTFRGHPASIAAIRAHLRIFERDRLADRAARLDRTMFRLLGEVADRHASVRRVDGRGLHWTVELQGRDWRSWQGAPGPTTLAGAVAARAREAGALIGTSGEETSLFLAPPLIIEDDELQRLVEALDDGLFAADRILEMNEV